PEHGHRVKRYRDDAPLFSRFQIEHQIESAYARTVQLPSGGAIVIDHTEALVSVDVNSARAIKGGAIEETATRTNLEAAEEVARQARLRDLAGLIVIDFIDMEESRNRREVENRLRDALRQDRARVQFGSISKFGLLEMSRQRLRPALSEGASIPCPRCGGSGHIRDTESSALQILRVIQEESMKDNTAAVLVQVPVEVASFLLNEKRTEITKIELQQRIHVLLVPNKSLDTPLYKLERLKHDDARLDNLQASYTLAEEVDDPTTFTRRSQERSNKQEPLIKGILRDAPMPTPAAKPEVKAAKAEKAAPAATAPSTGGFFAWIKSLLGLGDTKAADDKAAASETQKRGERNGRGRQSDRPARDGEAKRNTRGGRNRNGSGRNADAAGEERAPRAERTERSEAKGERSERNGRGRRNGRNEQSRDDATATDIDVIASADSETTEAKPRNPRRERGERGGRRNGAANARSEYSTENNADQSADGREENNESIVTASAANEAPSYSYFDRAGASNADHAAAATEDQAVAADVTSTDGVTADTQTNERQPRESRRSRDRYGRDRRRRQDDSEGATETGSADSAETVEPTSAVASISVSATPIEVTREPVAATSAPATVGEATVGGMPRVQPYQLSVSDLEAVASQSGLIWVNSDAEKIAKVQAAIAAEPTPIHVPRERVPAAVVDHGPLILVETKRDLSQMQMPFDSQASNPQ
ncbi:MAG: ribonuclease E/G, partial [Burkholderiaceae bacterium]